MLKRILIIAVVVFAIVASWRRAAELTARPPAKEARRQSREQRQFNAQYAVRLREIDSIRAIEKRRDDSLNIIRGYDTYAESVRVAGIRATADAERRADSIVMGERMMEQNARWDSLQRIRDSVVQERRNRRPPLD